MRAPSYEAGLSDAHFATKTLQEKAQTLQMQPKNFGEYHVRMCLGSPLARGLEELGEGHEYLYLWINFLYSDKRESFRLQALSSVIQLSYMLL